MISSGVATTGLLSQWAGHSRCACLSCRLAGGEQRRGDDKAAVAVGWSFTMRLPFRLADGGLGAWHRGCCRGTNRRRTVRTACCMPEARTLQLHTNARPCLGWAKLTAHQAYCRLRRDLAGHDSGWQRHCSTVATARCWCMSNNARPGLRTAWPATRRHMWPHGTSRSEQAAGDASGGPCSGGGQGGCKEAAADSGQCDWGP